MSNDSIQLTRREVAFLMKRFKIRNPDTAIDTFIEYLVLRRVDPMTMKNELIRMMARENN